MAAEAGEAPSLESAVAVAEQSTRRTRDAVRVHSTALQQELVHTAQSLRKHLLSVASELEQQQQRQQQQQQQGPPPLRQSPPSFPSQMQGGAPAEVTDGAAAPPAVPDSAGEPPAHVRAQAGPSEGLPLPCQPRRTAAAVAQAGPPSELPGAAAAGQADPKRLVRESREVSTGAAAVRQPGDTGTLLSPVRLQSILWAAPSVMLLAETSPAMMFACCCLAD